MYADNEPHLENPPPKCIACSQLCAWEETAWACTSCKRVHKHSQLDCRFLDRSKTPPIAQDNTYRSGDEPLTGDRHAILMNQDGNSCNSVYTLRSDDVGQPGYSRNKGGSMAPCSRIAAEQGSRESGVKQLDRGEQDGDIDSMEVADNEEEIDPARVIIWVSELTAVCMGERPTDIERALWQVDSLVSTPELRLETLAADNEVELSDDMEIDD
ncbi:hypothetical protein FLONG3_10021 [Fusarium longipes]|uniref:Uncharacterized protein n=1 Tax=Fusarium longipes TaxID=694270 RepID=A0A395RSN3_9HYPO|nr:hypothetical protein FLONG3_10021 [Fusarium longipes]